MAGHRTVTPAMLAHLRAIAALGGRSTARKYGGWAAPHRTRKTKGSTKGLPPGLRTSTRSTTTRTGLGLGLKLPKLISTTTRATKLSAPRATKTRTTKTSTRTTTGSKR